jgi:hypothetical protein
MQHKSPKKIFLILSSSEIKASFLEEVLPAYDRHFENKTGS